MINGIDVFEGDNISDFAVVRENNSILIQKATEGLTFLDSLLNYRYGQSKKYGFKFGVYHFARHNNTTLEAKHFCDAIKNYDLDLYPVLDIEIEENWTKQQAINYVLEFNAYILKIHGVLPAIYTSYGFYTRYLKGNIPNQILWIASYGKQPDTYPEHSWQYTDKGLIDGVIGYVDRNYFSENILWKKEDDFVENIVVYNFGPDMHSAEILADYLNCPTVSNGRKFDYSKVKNVYAVGGKKEQYTSYLTRLISGKDRYLTNQAVLDFIKNGGK